jgi:Nucleotidyl transferase AbiEii toxin, Type IV TA system
VSIPAEHRSLFTADWIRDPDRLKALARRHKYNDVFTAELAAWCAEVHEHLHDLEDTVGVELMLMGGNAASLRFDAVQQRGSRDNDYLTVASRSDIERLMDAFAERFKALHPLFQPEVYEPANPAGELNMITYRIPVALLLDHGNATNNTIKVEFHFEAELPPAETVSGTVGPTQHPIRARLPELPYQFVLELMTLAAPPVGIDEERRGDAIPRQLYDLDILLASFASSGQWEAMVAYCLLRYSRECETWTIGVAADEPTAGIRDRLQRWASCSDSKSEPWRTIRAVQQSQLRQQVHREPWGWRARCLRLALAVECIDAENGWAIWQQALATAAFIPATKAKRFKNTLAELANVDARSLPPNLHDFAWEVLGNGKAPLAERVANAYTTLRGI